MASTCGPFPAFTAHPSAPQPLAHRMPTAAAPSRTPASWASCASAAARCTCTTETGRTPRQTFSRWGPLSARVWNLFVRVCALVRAGVCVRVTSGGVGGQRASGREGEPWNPAPHDLHTHASATPAPLQTMPHPLSLSHTHTHTHTHTYTHTNKQTHTHTHDKHTHKHTRQTHTHTNKHKNTHIPPPKKQNPPPPPPGVPRVRRGGPVSPRGVPQVSGARQHADAEQRRPLRQPGTPPSLLGAPGAGRPGPSLSPRPFDSQARCLRCWAPWALAPMRPQAPPIVPQAPYAAGAARTSCSKCWRNSAPPSSATADATGTSAWVATALGRRRGALTAAMRGAGPAPRWGAQRVDDWSAIARGGPATDKEGSLVAFLRARGGLRRSTKCGACDVVYGVAGRLYTRWGTRTEWGRIRCVACAAPSRSSRVVQSAARRRVATMLRSAPTVLPPPPPRQQAIHRLICHGRETTASRSRAGCVAAAV